MSGFLFSEALLAKQLGVEVSDLHICDTYKGGKRPDSFSSAFRVSATFVSC
jgi:hypothetical protein